METLLAPERSLNLWSTLAPCLSQAFHPVWLSDGDCSIEASLAKCDYCHGNMWWLCLTLLLIQGFWISLGGDTLTHHDLHRSGESRPSQHALASYELNHEFSKHWWTLASSCLSSAHFRCSWLWLRPIWMQPGLPELPWGRWDTCAGERPVCGFPVTHGRHWWNL